MRVLELYAEEFGLLEDRSFTFGAGLNLIEGANESGKSTLVALLRFLFYGFSRRSGEDAEERLRRLSRKGRRAAGSVTFLWQNKTVVLRREYVLHKVGGKETPVEQVQAFDRETGVVFDLGAKSAGEYFLSLPQTLYHSSICVRQSELEWVAKGQTSDAVFEFLFGGSSAARFEDAVKLLDEARRELQHQRGAGGRIPQLSAEQQALQIAISSSTEAAERLRVLDSEMQELAARSADIQYRQTQLDGMLEAMRLDGELARYDEWHAARSRERMAADDHAAVCGMRDELPSIEKIEAAQAVASACSAAVQKKALCRQAYDGAQRELAMLAVRDADRRVKALGGVAATDAYVMGLCHRVRVSGRLALIWLLLSMLLGVGAIALTALRLPLGCLCAVGALAGLSSWCVRIHARKKRCAVLDELGLDSPYMLRTFLTEYEQREAVRTVAMQALADAKRTYEEAQEACRLEQEALSRSLTALGLDGGDGQDAEAALSTLWQRCRQLGQAADEKSHALKIAGSVCDALGKGLAPDAEAAIRAARLQLPSPTHPREVLCRERETLRAELQKIQQMRDVAVREEQALRAQTGDVIRLREQWQKNEDELAAASHKLAALKLAREALDKADATLRGGVMPRLAEQASMILRELTDGAYVRLHVPKGFEASLETKEGVYPLSYFSAGARDVTYFALRIALLGLLTSEPLPLLLDEVCARLDDARAANLLRFLKTYCAKGAQCLLFTCHSRERSLLDVPSCQHIVL